MAGTLEQSSLVPKGDLATDKTCPFCREQVHARAKKCKSCGEWLVETQLSKVSQLLEIFGWVEIALGVIAMLGIWFVGKQLTDYSVAVTGDRSQGWMVWMYGAGGLVYFLYSLFIGLLIIAFAERGERRP